MIAVRLHLAAAVGIVRRDLQQYLSYRFRWVTQLLNATLSLALFYYLSRLIAVDRVGGVENYFAFAIVGVAVLQLVTAALTTVPTVVRGELMTGTFERLVLSPFGAVASVVSAAIFPVLLALAIAAATVVIGGVLFGLELRWSTVPLAVPTAVLAAFAFLPFAVLATAFALVAKRGAVVTSYVTTALSLTSGAFFPVTLLPGWLRWVSEVQPLTPALDLLRSQLVGTTTRYDGLVDVIKLIGFGAVLLPVSALVLTAAVDFGRRRGTLTEF